MELTTQEHESRESRKHRRFDVQCPVAFCGDSVKLGIGEIINLSDGGGAIASDAVVSTGDYIELRIKLPQVQSVLEVELAPVRWKAQGKFGVEFIRMSPEATQILRRFIKLCDEQAKLAM